MSALPKKRIRTTYPGVFYRISHGERAYYITYRVRQPNGHWKQHEELAGRANRDRMTAAKAARVRSKRLTGREEPNRERRAKALKIKKVWTISALWQEYKKANPDLKSYKDYNSQFNRYIGPSFGDKEPKEILALDIDRLRRRQLKDRSPQTVKHALELLRRICNFGIKRSLCPGLSFIIQMPRFDNTKTEDLTPEQLKRLLEVISYYTKNRTPYNMAAYAMKLVLLTGLRAGELFRLKWEDIQWHRQNIKLYETKSGRPETIPMSSYTERLLKEIKESGDTGDVYIFPGKGGKMRTSMRTSANKIKAEAGLPADFRALHGLRHQFGTNLGNSGVDQDIIARLMTHSRGDRVTSRYVHYREETLRQAAELAGRLVERAKATSLTELNAT